MKQIDKIKRDIAEITESLELAGYLDSVTTAAVYIVRKNIQMKWFLRIED